MATVNQEFESAPMGRRLVTSAIIIFTVALAGAASSIFVSYTRMSAQVPPGTKAIGFLAPFVGLFVVLPVFFFQRSRVARFRIEENCLVLGRKRYPLESLVSIARDPEILRWAFRKAGNGGLGAISGRYWSRRVGKFDAFLTGAENAVVLRWADKTVAVSPSDPEFFIYCARSAAGLK